MRRSYHPPIRNNVTLMRVRGQEVLCVLSTLLFSWFQQPSLLRPAGPDGGRTSCPSSLLRGGGVRQLGAAPPRLLSTWTHPAPAVSGGSRPPPGVCHQPAGRELPPSPVQPEPWQPPAPLRRGPVTTSYRQDEWRGRPAATRCTFRRQRHLIDRLSRSHVTLFLAHVCSRLAMRAGFWLTALLQRSLCRRQLKTTKPWTDSRLLCCLHFSWLAAAHQHQDPVSYHTLFQMKLISSERWVRKTRARRIKVNLLNNCWLYSVMFECMWQTEEVMCTCTSAVRWKPSIKNLFRKTAALFIHIYYF